MKNGDRGRRFYVVKLVFGGKTRSRFLERKLGKELPPVK